MMGCLARFDAATLNARGNVVFVSGRTAHPSGQPKEIPMASGGKRGRDAGSGRFIPVEVAQVRKSTAIVETVKTSTKKKS